jgi:predicted site-specific integrase-resolvase
MSQVAELPEKFISLKEASNHLGFPYWKLQRAAKQGLFPTYNIYNGRVLVRLSEVNAAVERSREGDVQ